MYCLWCSELPSYEIVIQNRVTQNDVTLGVTNSKFYRNSSFELLTGLHKILNLLTRRFNFYFSSFKSLTWSPKIEVVTRNQKAKIFTLSY